MTRKITLMTRKIFLFLLIILSFSVILTNTFKTNAQTENNDNSYYSLLDDYYIQNKDQWRFGVCWDFAGTRTLETVLAKELNEFYSFSEAGIANGDRAIIGDGSNFAQQHSIFVNRDGVLLEEDFPYQNLMYVLGPRGGLKTNADKYMQNLDSLRLRYLNHGVFDHKSFKHDEINKIKEHIKNHSSVITILEKYSFQYGIKGTRYVTNGSTFNAHAVTIIGWDDNYQIPNSAKGAYIVLDSSNRHAYDSIFYLPYNYNSNYVGYFIKDKDLIKSRKNNNYLENPLYLKNSTQNNFKPQTGHKLKNNNIFSHDQIVDITYLKPTNYDRFDLKIDVTYQNKDVNNLFSVIKEGNDFRLKSKSTITAGKYKVKLNYLKKINEEYKEFQEIRELFVTDYTELNYFQVQFQRDENNPTYFLKKDQLFNNKDSFVVIKNDGNSIGRFAILPSLYHKIIKYSVNDGNEYNIDKINIFDKEIRYDFKNTDEGMEKGTITFTLEDGNKVTKNIYAYSLNKNKSYVFPNIIYNFGDAYAENFVPSFVPFSPNSDSKLNKLYFTSFKKENHKLIGYEVEDANGQKHTISTKDDNGFYLTGDLEFINKFHYNGYNHVIKAGSFWPTDYKYTIFAKPLFEKIDTPKPEINFNDLTINVTQNKEFTAFDTINLTDLTVTATNNSQNVPIKLTGIKYQNNQYLEVNDSVTLLIEYNNENYEYTYPNLKINKKNVDFKFPTMTEFIHDGNLKKLNILKNDLYTITNNEKTEIGNYIAKIILKNQKNYVFNNNSAEISIEWQIKNQKVDDYTDIKVTSNIGNNFTSLTTLDKKDFVASAMLADAKISLEIKTIIYENHNYISINDSYVKFELHHNNKKVNDYKFYINVSKNIVDFTLPKETIFYFDNQPKTLIVAENDKYTITNKTETNIGKYEAKIEIIDKVNYEFTNTKTTLTIPWEIKEPKIENIQVADILQKLYYSLSTINIEDLVAHATVNEIAETKLQIINIRYLNGDKLQTNDKYVILTLNYNTFEFEHNYSITVNKNILSLDFPDIKTFTYDGKPKSLEIKQNDKYQIKNNIQTNVGNYQTIVSIIDKNNYTFENDLSSITIDWQIISRGITNLTINSKTNTFNSLSTIDENNFTITADLDGEKINLNITKIVYNNQNKLQINDKFVTLNINYLDTNLTEKFNIKVIKNVIDFQEPETKKFIYDGNVKQLNISNNKYYTIQNNSNTNVGIYQAVITLNDSTNYIFSNNLSEIIINWKIEKAKIKFTKDKKERIIFEKNENLLYSYDKKTWLPYTSETAIDTKNETVYFKINENYEEMAVLTKDLANFKVSKSNGIIIGIFALTVSIGLVAVFGTFYYIKNKRKN